MPVNDRELSIFFHWERLRTSYQISDGKELPSNLLREAEISHVSCVLDALAQLHMMAVSLSSGQLAVEAAAQLGRGFGRRTKFIWLSIHEILREIPPTHNTPLSIEVAENASKALNEIYINIRGSLDNLARCLLANRPDIPNEKPLAPIQIDIFNAKFLERIGDDEISSFVDRFRKWNSELKDRRDPAAHRLSLFVLQAYHDQETYGKHIAARTAYLNANNKALAALSDGKYHDDLILEAEKRREKLLRIGKFHPLFTYDDTIGFMAIYPTVAEDVGQLIVIGRKVLAIISRQMGEKR